MKDFPALADTVSQDIELLRVSLTFGQWAKIKPLKVELVPDDCPLWVRLRNYMREQCELLSKIMDSFLRYRMVWSNPMPPWACVSLLSPKQGPAKWWFYRQSSFD